MMYPCLAGTRCVVFLGADKQWHLIAVDAYGLWTGYEETHPTSAAAHDAARTAITHNREMTSIVTPHDP